MNYFQLLCFAWALIGIGSRIAMGLMGSKWNEWELNSAYKEEKPKMLNIIGILGLIVVAYTWYQVIQLNIPFSWILAVLVSFTVLKISAILFNYSAFRSFVSKTLNDRKKMLYLNSGVILFSLVMILMGVFLY